MTKSYISPSIRCVETISSSALTVSATPKFLINKKSTDVTADSKLRAGSFFDDEEPFSSSDYYSSYNE